MNILGISCFYHDSSAAIIKDGKTIAAAQEERWSRKKHDIEFPENAIAYCLREAGITIKDIDYVAFYDKPLLKFERLLESSLETFPKSIGIFTEALPGWFMEKLRMPSLLSRKLGYKREILYAEHHLSHAAGAFYASPFEEAAILTADGVGEWATTTLGTGKGNEICILKDINFPHSLGLLYSTVTGYLGFKINNDEYKVMGLAPYGNPAYTEKFRKVIDIKEDGSYRMDMRYFVYHHKAKMHSKKFEELFGEPRKPESQVDQHHKDIAASLQKIIEEIYFNMLNHLYEASGGMASLCLSGGVALNSVANGKITKNTKFRKIYVPPAPSDAGSSMGAALAAWHIALGQKRRHPVNTALFGPSYDDSYIENFLKTSCIKYTRLSEAEMLKKVAKLLWEDKVVGWFQGRMEFGERALGARSILASPCNPEMKDILNLKVKHREQFRPFAPAVTLEDAKKYFEVDIEVPFMSFVYPVKEYARQKLPAITHIDGTGRLQTVTEEQNPKYHGLIKEFEKHSNIPVLVNTSFNIRGEPIVMTPQHAYRCMTGTGIDFLAMGSFLIRREDNPQHLWDSEHLAKD